LQRASTSYDASYENKALLLFSVGLGLVGLDRFILMPLFPVVAKDLGLDYQDIGLISGVLSLTWGIASIVSGGVSDKRGRRFVIIPAVVLFSVLAGLTGLAVGFISLVVVRALMGLFEGAYLPASIAATTEASHPSHLGRNVGIQQMAQPLLGLALGPLLATQLLNVVPSWRWIFLLVSIPGLILAWYMYRDLRDTNAGATSTQAQLVGWSATFRYRNVILNILIMSCWLSCLVVIAAFLPNYMVDHLHFSLPEMGLVMSASGLGSAIGMVLIPSLSDRLGRKPVLLFGVVLEIGLLFLFVQSATVAQMAGLIFLITGINAGLIVLTIGPLTTEAVPPALTATAVGMVVGIGELVGGFGAPAIAGAVAQNFGITYILWISTGAVILGFLLSLFVTETRSVEKVAVTA
jgi:MFS family permease